MHHGSFFDLGLWAGLHYHSEKRDRKTFLWASMEEHGGPVTRLMDTMTMTTGHIGGIARTSGPQSSSRVFEKGDAF